MRIANVTLQNQGISSLSKAQTAVNKTHLQLASQSRILQPADDPLASAKIRAVESELNTLNQYEQSISAAKQNLTMVDTTLEQVADLLIKIQTLQKQGLSGTTSLADRQIIAIEMQGLLDSTIALANQQDRENHYIFSGFQSNHAPYAQDNTNTYVYQGDSGVNQVKIGPGNYLSMNYTGEAVFNNSTDGNLFNTVNQIIQTLQLVDADDSYNQSMLALSGTLDEEFNQLVQVRTKVDAGLSQLETQMDINDEHILQQQVTLSSLRDLDPIEATSRLVMQMNALEAAQVSFMRISELTLLNYL